MTTTPAAPPSTASQHLEDLLLRELTAATWPDGSLLIDVAPEMLRTRLLPQLTKAVTTEENG